MKVSLQLANQYSNIDFTTISVDEILRRIGAQLGAVEEVIDYASRFQGVVIAKVVLCEKHPNADKLNVCLVDDGGVAQGVDRNADGLVQVVCGAPNVRAGITVAWLPPGSTVPSSVDKDPFVLGSRELRGIVSNGMLASAMELGISEDHDGILEISDPGAAPGSPLLNLFGLNDVIIDCENKMFTHRPDCFGVLGVARELAGITGQAFVSPDWYNQSAVSSAAPEGTLALAGKNEVVHKVPRFMVQVVEGVTMGPSSTQVQSWLSRLGSRPINNIVDATNFYMHLTAQPTHVFDYDKVKAICNDPENVVIFPRMAVEGEKIDLLNGKTITLTAEDIVIATDKQAIALGGVMGGAATEVDDTTKNIIVECANFDMYTIRRTSMRHGLFTDAVTRFNKGQSPLQNAIVLQKLVADICEQTNAKAGVQYDSAPEESSFVLEPVAVSVDFVNARLGSSLDAEDMQTLLTNVEFQVEVSEGNLVVTPPFWRKDIEIVEDIVEEVGRLHGYDKLPIVLPMRTTAPAAKNPSLELKSRLRSTLARAGASEIVTYSFVSGKLLEDATQNTTEAYQLGNALSPELQYYRLTLTPSLASKVYQNIRAGYDQFALFEIGKTHIKGQGVNDEGLPIENEVFSLVYAANDKKVAEGTGAAYFNAKQYLDFVAQSLGLTLDFDPIDKDPAYEITKPYDIERSALVTDRSTGNYIGIVGEFKASVRKKLKLPTHSAGFELMLSPILESITGTKRAYKPLARFPHIVQDITFKTSKEQQFGDLFEAVSETAQQQAEPHGYVASVESRDIYHKEHSPQKHITLRLDVHHPDRTLTTDEVTKFVDAIVSGVEQKLDVKRD